VYATVQENVRKAFEEAKKLVEEEAEIAKRASEAEYKRLADQEAMKVAVEMAARIAVVEAQKLAEAQEMGQDQDQDTIMLDQETNEQASGKGKGIIVDSTPSSSPVRTIRESGSPSSAIPPAVQAALDDMKAEISEIKNDMKAGGQATNEKIDRMMNFLQDLASRFPKP
jgi:ABC-type transporter MlaC component